MKMNFSGSILFALCTILSLPCLAQPNLTITNGSSIARADELIVLPKLLLEKKLGKIAKGKYVLIQTPDKRPVVVQYDDMDKDGSWDEAAFLYSFIPKQKIVFQLVVADAPATIKAVVRAHVRLRKKQEDQTFGEDLVKDFIPAGQPATNFAQEPLPLFLTEGPAWENDKVGFRLYFDVRNGKDIWGKLSSAMVMDEVGVNSANNYHELADWGMDILKVGPSLGAGSLALSVPLPRDSTGKDTLVRLGGVNMGKVSFEKLADGPVRAIFRMQYPEWKVLDSMGTASLTEDISIWGGKYFYESNVTVVNAPAKAKLVTGIVNLHSKKSQQIDTAGSKVLYTYDAQSENKDSLGMGIILSKKYFNSFGTTIDSLADVQHTYTIAVKPDIKQAQFRFYAGWEKTDDQFKTERGFREFIQEEAILLKSPLKIQ